MTTEYGKKSKDATERPILFSGEMVRAILGNTKTQSRRLIRNAYIDNNGNFICGKMNYGQDTYGRPRLDHFNNKSRYGKPGDFLYVRETIYRDISGNIAYAADGECPFRKEICTVIPSIHMKKQYSRIRLQILGIRAERLQDITESDARAEGIIFIDHGKDQYGQQNPGWGIGSQAVLGPQYCLSCARFAFANLWDSIHNVPEHMWDSNPFVQTFEFRRVL